MKFDLILNRQPIVAKVLALVVPITLNKDIVFFICNTLIKDSRKNICNTLIKYITKAFGKNQIL
jgi:hypothetical protein